MDLSNRILTISDATDLADIIRMAQGGRRVARLMPDDSPLAGEVLTGTARSIGDDRGNFLANGADVRDAYLRVTLNSGFEAFWPVAELIMAHRDGMFLEDSRSGS